MKSSFRVLKTMLPSFYVQTLRFSFREKLVGANVCSTFHLFVECRTVTGFGLIKKSNIYG